MPNKGRGNIEVLFSLTEHNEPQTASQFANHAEEFLKGRRGTFLVEMAMPKNVPDAMLLRTLFRKPEAMDAYAAILDGEHLPAFWGDFLRHLAQKVREGHSVHWLERMPERNYAAIVEKLGFEERLAEAMQKYAKGHYEEGVALARKTLKEIFEINALRKTAAESNIRDAIRAGQKNKQARPIVVWQGVAHSMEARALKRELEKAGATVSVRVVPFKTDPFSSLVRKRMLYPNQPISDEEVQRALMGSYVFYTLRPHLGHEKAVRKSMAIAREATPQEIRNVSVELGRRKGEAIEEILRRLRERKQRP